MWIRQAAIIFIFLLFRRCPVLPLWELAGASRLCSVLCRYLNLIETGCCCCFDPAFCSSNPGDYGQAQARGDIVALLHFENVGCGALLVLINLSG